MAKMIALITGASSGFGRLIANALAGAGHIAYASMRGLDGKNASQVEAVAAYAREHGVDLRALELDVQSDDSASAAVDRIIGEHGRLDILVHNAGHMVWGPSEAFTPEQLAASYRAPLPRGPITSPMQVPRATWRAPPSTR
jgi:NAD(P)-dependent dehydrogenase (short-subunit alcohol dehydrogenase family)